MWSEAHTCIANYAPSKPFFDIKLEYLPLFLFYENIVFAQCFRPIRWGRFISGMPNLTHHHKSFAVVVLTGSLAVLAATGLVGQTVEEHPAPIVQGPQVTTLSAATFADRPNDPTPFGVALSGLLLVDAHANGGKLVRHDGIAGVNTSYAGPTAQNAALRNLLAKYVGQPLSFRLLSSIQTDITAFFRENGRSLVSVTVPQQEITSGVVQINVTTFVLATTTIEGADPETAAFLNRQVRLRPGQEVDTDRLLDDVNWLNQNPFRHVSVVFEPGQVPGSTVLTLQVKTGRTWSGYAGISNAGTEDTGVLRVYGGVNISALPWKDQQLSYQFTGSPESLAKFRLWDTGTDKGYLSHALSYFIPITTQSGFRTKLSFGASHISSYSEPGGVFTAGTETVVLNSEAAFPLPKTSGRFSLVPEIYAQVEYNDYDKLQYFVGIPITEEKTRLLHAALGFRAGMSGPIFDKNSRGSADVALVIGRRETEGFDASDYAYAKVSLKEEIFLDRDKSLAFRFSGQKSRDDLHLLEQMALGGGNTVRGYPVNDVAGDTAYAASIEYRGPQWSFRAGKEDATFKPHIFADFGFAEQDAPFDDEHMASIGIGGEIAIGKNVVGTIDLAQTLQAAGATAANAPSVAFQLTARF